MKQFKPGAVSFVVLACLLLLAPESWAQERRGPRNGYGFRLGLGLQPDQFVVGAQALLGQRFKIFRLAPSFDVGWGNDVTTYVLNGDLELHLPLPISRSSLYLCAVAILVCLQFDGASNDTDVGVNLLGGLRLATNGRTNYLFEARFGIGDTPDFRLFAGILLGSGSPHASVGQ